MTLIERVHGNFVYNRRVERLCTHLSAVMPHGRARVLDIGCGDGLLSSMIMEARSDLEIVGIDVLIRPRTHIPVTEFDGRRIPFANDSVDGAMFVDVLHHTPDPMVLLREADDDATQTLPIGAFSLPGNDDEKTITLPPPQRAAPARDRRDAGPRLPISRRFDSTEAMRRLARAGAGDEIEQTVRLDRAALAAASEPPAAAPKRVAEPAVAPRPPPTSWLLWAGVTIAALVAVAIAIA